MMAKTVKKGVVAFAATVAMLFGSVLLAGYGQPNSRYGQTDGFEIISESFDVYGVRVVEINVEHGLRVEFSDTVVGRATLKTEAGSADSPRYTGRVNNGVLQINGSGYGFENVLTLPSSVKEIRISSTKDSTPNLDFNSTDPVRLSELTVKSDKPVQLAFTNMNIKQLLVDLPDNSGENVLQQLRFTKTTIGEFKVNMGFGDFSMSSDSSFEQGLFYLGDSVVLSDWPVRLLRKMVVSTFKSP